VVIFRTMRNGTKNIKLQNHYRTTYLLTSWCKVLPEKLSGLQLVKKFPVFCLKPKVHYRIHKRPPTVSTLGPPNTVYIPTSHLLEIHFNIIYASTPRSPQWSLSLRFPPQELNTPPSQPYASHSQPISLF